MKMEMTSGYCESLPEALNLLTQDLYSFLSSVQKPAFHEPAWIKACQERCHDLRCRVLALKKNIAGNQSTLVAALEKLYQYLLAFYKELTCPGQTPSSVRLRELATSLGHTYEEVFAEYRLLRDQSALQLPRLKHVKPINYARNVFHVANGLIAIVLYHYLLTREQALVILMALLAAAATTEITRRFSKRWNDFLVDRVFGLISRPRERYEVNSATYYLFALTLITYFLPKEAIEAALLVLALADPAATIIGRRWGVKKLWHDRSILGTFTFFGVSMVSTFAFFMIMTPHLGGWTTKMAAAASIGIAGALAELFSVSLDDNFTVPLLCGWMASLWF